MSKYTTGEMAKLCGVSVRTVQYYDSRGILLPSQLSEGGRRLYSEKDLERMKFICFLRDLDLPINSIKELLAEENFDEVLAILLDEQEKKLRLEIEERRSQLEKLCGLKQFLKKSATFSMESIGDIASIMENRKKLRSIYLRMIAVGIVMDAVEIGTLILWILKGIWWPFALGMCVVCGMGIGISRFYVKRVAYICPECHKVFKPNFRQMFFTKHTPSTRKLKCVSCGYHGFCVETYGGEEKEK
ncbi:MerR family transcriptional regulator [Clostridiales bacterium]|nr:MerR family transcriptional regulator [Clostridiales bacterium]